MGTKKMASIRQFLTLGRSQFQISTLPQVLCKLKPYKQTCASPAISNFHTSSSKYDLMEFFDKKDMWGEKTVPSGRPYRIDELRLKSNQDLHKLWYVLLKERNMLLTMQAEYERNVELFPNPERIEKVEESMEGILAVVAERDEAVQRLEEGEPKPKGQYVRDFLGRVRWRESREHALPEHMNKPYSLLWPKKFRRENQEYLALWREKISRHKWANYHKREEKNKDLAQRFPNLEGQLHTDKPEE